MTLFRTIVAPYISECKADAGCPLLLIKQAVGPTEYDQFRTKKKNGALDALRGHRTRTLAGILVNNAVYNADYWCRDGRTGAIFRVPDDTPQTAYLSRTAITASRPPTSGPSAL